MPAAKAGTPPTKIPAAKMAHWDCKEKQSVAFATHFHFALEVLERPDSRIPGLL